MHVKARKARAITAMAAVLVTIVWLLAPSGAAAAPTDWQTMTGTVQGRAFGPMAVGTTHTRTNADARVTGTLMVYSQRGWLAVALSGTRAADGQLHATLGRGRGTGRFHAGVTGGTLDQRTDGTLVVTLHRAGD